MQPAMVFTSHSRPGGGGGGGRRPFAPSSTSEAHFSRSARLAADQRHAGVLHKIATRPAHTATGAFMGPEAEKHVYFARTLAARRVASRAADEFARQKANLLLLQRLQQLDNYEHPAYTRRQVRGGKNYAKEWTDHQRRYDEARARLAKRPRAGSSAVFARTCEESLLSPRRRKEWDAPKPQPYRDTTGDRDPPHHQAKPARDSGAAVPPAGSATAQIQVTRMRVEREKIEQELERRWAAFDAADAGDRGSVSAGLDPTLETELGLEADTEDPAIQVWLSTHSNNGFAPGHSRPPPSAPMHPPMNSSRQRAMRARYIDSDEEDIYCDDPDSLFDLAAHPQLDRYAYPYSHAQAATNEHPVEDTWPEAAFGGASGDALTSAHSREIDDVLAVLSDFPDLEGQSHARGTTSRRDLLAQSRDDFYHIQHAALADSPSTSSFESSSAAGSSFTPVAPVAPAPHTAYYARAPHRSHAPTSRVCDYREEEKEGPSSSEAEAEADRYLHQLAASFGTRYDRPSHAPEQLRPRPPPPQATHTLAQAPTPPGFLRPTYSTRAYATQNQATRPRTAVQ